jgi:DNA-binding NarL/FixJ family response regulator
VTPVRVVLADDQALVRSGLRRILTTRRGVDVVAEAADGQQAVEAVRRHAPDVVVMDVRMPVLDGVAAIRALREARIDVPVLTLTTYDDDEVLAAALRAGAAGFVTKAAPAEDLLRAVKEVAAGAAWLEPSITARVLADLRAHREPSGPPVQALLDPLTDREREVLVLMARAASNAEIAERLVVSEGTVKTHIGRIFTKLGARDRAAAIVWAYDAGLVRPSADAT